MLTVFWITTPLSGSLFSTSKISRTVTTPITSTSQLVSVEEQNQQLDIGFLTDGYAHLWLGQTLPNFTTAEGALLPFALDERFPLSNHNASCKAKTLMYTTSLDCRPAKISGNSVHNLTFDNGKGCVASGVDFWNANLGWYSAFYIGWYNDPSTDWSLSELGCSPDSEHDFLGVWAGRNGNAHQNVTAVFCEPSYHVTEVNATVTLPNLTVSEVVPLSSPLTLKSEDFNASAFEYILGAGIGAAPARADIPQTSMIDVWPRLENMSLSWPTTNMLSFAIGTTHLQPSDYLNHSALATSFEQAHKLLFALAIRSLMTNTTPSTNRDLATFARDEQVVLMPKSLSIVVEASLAVATIFALGLYCFVRARPNQLLEDPASLSDFLKILSTSEIGADKKSKCQLSPAFGQRIMIVKGKLVRPDCSIPQKGSSGQQNHQIDPSYPTKASLPKEMTAIVGLPFVAIIIAALIGLVVLRNSIHRYDGLPLPSQNTTVTLLVLNYLPIGFATFLEPFWVLLNRWLCVLQPFEEIRKGNGRPSRSIDLNYTSLPPQLVFWRALRNGSLILVLVCACTLSANVLAVSLNAIFSTSSVSTNINNPFMAVYSPVYQNTSSPDRADGNAIRFEDHFFVAKSNITNGTPLPPFVDENRYYLPFQLGNESNSAGQVQLKGTTPAFGLDVVCKDTSRLDSDTRAYLSDSAIIGDSQDSGVPLYIEMRDSNGEKYNCSSEVAALGNYPGQKLAAEFVSLLNATNPHATADQIDGCRRTLLVAFFRGDFSHESQDPRKDRASNQSVVHSVSGMYLACSPTLYLGSSNITVDPSGYVLNASTVYEPSENSSSLFGYEQNKSMLYQTMNTLIRYGDSIGTADEPTIWHNDTFADKWLTYLIKISTNSSAFLDPNLPLPSPDALIPNIEHMYSRLFAITMGLSTHFLAVAPPGTSIPGQRINVEDRVFMDTSMFVITVAILVFNIIVGGAYYLRRPKRMLQCMPTTIANLMKVFEGSGLIEEDLGSGEHREAHRIGYGRFVGLDGKPHIGIERRPFVLPWNEK